MTVRNRGNVAKKMQIHLQKYQKYWKSKNDFKSTPRAFIKECWEIVSFFTNMKFDSFQKHYRRPNKNQIPDTKRLKK